MDSHPPPPRDLAPWGWEGAVKGLHLGAVSMPNECVYVIYMYLYICNQTTHSLAERTLPPPPPQCTHDASTCTCNHTVRGTTVPHCASDALTQALQPCLSEDRACVGRPTGAEPALCRDSLVPICRTVTTHLFVAMGRGLSRLLPSFHDSFSGKQRVAYPPAPLKPPPAIQLVGGPSPGHFS